MDPQIEALRGRLVVSCQAYPGEPMRDPNTIAQVAAAVVAGGAAAVRAEGLDDIRAVRALVDVPTIGLWKDGEDGIYVTPTLAHAVAVAEAGAQIVALDGTRRERADGRTLAQTISELKVAHPGVLAMADCGSFEDAVAAEQAGADILGTTLAGYSDERSKTDGPDFEFVDQVVAGCGLPVMVEGRVHTTAQAAEAMRRGAFAVCVGTAITHPTTITGWFNKAVRDVRRSPPQAAAPGLDPMDQTPRPRRLDA